MNRRELLRLAPAALLGGCGIKLSDDAAKVPRQANIVHAFLWFETLTPWRSPNGRTAYAKLRMSPLGLKVNSATVVVAWQGLIGNVRTAPLATIWQGDDQATVLYESHQPLALPDPLAVFEFEIPADNAIGGEVWVDDAAFEVLGHGEVLWATVPPIFIGAPR